MDANDRFWPGIDDQQVCSSRRAGTLPELAYRPQMGIVLRAVAIEQTTLALQHFASFGSDVGLALSATLVQRVRSRPNLASLRLCVVSMRKCNDLSVSLKVWT